MPAGVHAQELQPPASAPRTWPSEWLQIAAERHRDRLERSSGAWQQTPPQERGAISQDEPFRKELFRKVFFGGGLMIENRRLNQVQSTQTTTFRPPGNNPITQTQNQLDPKSTEFELAKAAVALFAAVESTPRQVTDRIQLTVDGKVTTFFPHHTVEVLPQNGNADTSSGTAVGFGVQGGAKMTLAEIYGYSFETDLRVDVSMFDLLNDHLEKKGANTTVANDRVTMDLSAAKGLSFSGGFGNPGRLMIRGEGEWTWFTLDLSSTREGIVGATPFTFTKEGHFEQKSSFSVGPSVTYQVTPKIAAEGKALFGRGGHQFRFSARLTFR
jgi:hypothetical protein